MTIIVMIMLRMVVCITLVRGRVGVMWGAVRIVNDMGVHPRIRTVLPTHHVTFGVINNMGVGTVPRGWGTLCNGVVVSVLYDVRRVFICILVMRMMHITLRVMHTIGGSCRGDFDATSFGLW